jgi:hypothetical protein
MDQSDVDTLMQRSADWLRRGVNPDRNGSESEIAKDLQHLSQQTHEAGQAMGDAAQGQGQQQGQIAQSAIDQAESLRNRLESLDRNFGQNSGTTSGGNTPSGNAQPGAGGRAGDFVNGGGARGARQGGPVYGGMNTGNNAPLPQPSSAGPDPTTPERVYRDYQDTVAGLDQLRQTLRGDPDARRQVDALVLEMQRLDPRRFPGNPAIIEQLRAQVLGDIDKLELQLQREANGDKSGAARNTESLPVPAGYEDAVAEYFRRLSKNP